MTTMIITMDIIRGRVNYLNKLVDGVEFGIGGAYGGHRLERLYASGGCEGLTSYGTKKELLDYINAFIAGIELVNNIK